MNAQTVKLNGVNHNSMWLATPMLRLARNKAKGTVLIQQMWVDHETGAQDWRELPMIDVVDKPTIINGQAN